MLHVVINRGPETTHHKLYVYIMDWFRAHTFVCSGKEAEENKSSSLGKFD